MTPKRAFLLGVLAVAVVLAVVVSARLVRGTGSRRPGPSAGTADVAAAPAGPPTGVSSGAPAVVQLYKDPKPVTPFSVQTLDGTVLRSQDLKGKVVILNFWATWCPPCRAEIPDLVALQDKYRDQVVVLGISMDEGPAEDVRRFAEKYQVNYPVAMATPAIYQAFPGMASLPTSLIVDREGMVVQKHIGMLNAALTEEETRLLAGLPTTATVERIEADKPVGLANASQVREIPGVELARLTPARRGEALLKLNEEACTCGCGLTVARCRVDDPHCSVSLPLAKQIVDGMAALQ